MKYLPLIFAVVLVSCAEDREDSLAVTFRPAFIESCDLKVSGDSLSITVYNTHEDTIRIVHRETMQVHSSMMDSVQSIFKGFRFTVVKWKDGLNDTTKFEKAIYEGDAIEYELTGLGADGVTVRGVFTRNNKRSHFKFWSPDANTDKHRVASQLIYLMDRSLHTAESQLYLEKLKFFFDLPTTFDPWAKTKAR